MEHGTVLSFNIAEMSGVMGTPVGEVVFNLNSGPRPERHLVPNTGERVSLEIWLQPNGQQTATRWWYQQENPPRWSGNIMMSETRLSIEGNLRRLGIPDMQITGHVWAGERDAIERSVVHIGPILLSALCDNSWYNQIVGKRTRGDEIDSRVYVYDEKRDKIGFVSEGRFAFEQAPDLRTCLGWAAATDLGREQVLTFRLDEASMKLTQTIQRAGAFIDNDEALKDFFHGIYFRAVEEIYVQGTATSYGDGYCSVAGLLWRVGIRTVHGREHPGFTYSY